MPASPTTTATTTENRGGEDGDERSNVAIFLTGGTGYIGAHVAANLLEQHDATLNLLVRGRDPRDAELRLWQALQLHLPFPKFYEYLQAKIRIFRGDLTSRSLGSKPATTTGSCTPPIR
jgi:thioester reductase-like protein